MDQPKPFHWTADRCTKTVYLNIDGVTRGWNIPEGVSITNIDDIIKHGVPVALDEHEE